MLPEDRAIREASANHRGSVICALLKRNSENVPPILDRSHKRPDADVLHVIDRKRKLLRKCRLSEGMDPGFLKIISRGPRQVTLSVWVGPLRLSTLKFTREHASRWRIGCVSAAMTRAA